jgi:hypothetical protein
MATCGNYGGSIVLNPLNQSHAIAQMLRFQSIWSFVMEMMKNLPGSHLGAMPMGFYNPMLWACGEQNLAELQNRLTLYNTADSLKRFADLSESHFE